MLKKRITMCYPSRKVLLILHLVENKAHGNCFLFFFFLLCQQQQIGDFSTFPPLRLQSWSGARARACARGRRDETTGAGILPGHVGIQNNQSGHRQSRKIINRTLTALIGRISGKVFIRYLQLFFLCCCGR